MSIDLADYEAAEPFAGNYDKALAKLQKKLEHIQAAHIVHKRASIVMFEGWDTAGKGGIIQRMTACWDQRWYEVWPIGAPTADEKARHFLWRFWTRIPAAGEIAVFDRSWYGRVLVERVEGFASNAEWQRGYDEINAFEGQLAENGVTLIKLFIHISQEEQDKRLASRLNSPWKRWKTGPDDFHNRSKREDYLSAMADMFAHTDTRWAPWKAINGNDKKAARIAALTHIVERLEKAVQMTMPDADPEVVKLAEQAFGYKPDEK